MSDESSRWIEHFRIQSMVDLDFVIGQKVHSPVGMQRNSSPDFKRRILAAMQSHNLQLQSIDYTLKRYVEPDLYETEDILLGDKVSDYLGASVSTLMKELPKLHAQEPQFGVFGAEMTLYRVPHSLDAARMLSNRGLLLEVFPLLRLCLEMAAWADTAFDLTNEDKVRLLQSEACISNLKKTYGSVGKFYGYLSSFTHWRHIVHADFLYANDGEAGIVTASVRYRAMGLAACLIILDILIAVIQRLYGAKSHAVVEAIQGQTVSRSSRNSLSLLAEIAQLTELDDIHLIFSFLE